MFVAIELKVPGDDATKRQKFELDAILDAGGRTAVCHSKEEVQQFLDEIMKGR
jgi:hypothetical protein